MGNTMEKKRGLYLIRRRKKTWTNRECGTTRLDEGVMVQTLKRTNTVEGWREVLKSFTSGRRGAYWGGWVGT